MILAGFEDYTDNEFNTVKEYKEAILSVIDRDLEVFDPIVDGDVELSEGSAYLREKVEKFFNKNTFISNVDIIKEELLNYIEKVPRGLSKTQKEGYKFEIGVVKEVINEIESIKLDRELNAEFELV